MDKFRHRDRCISGRILLSLFGKANCKVPADRMAQNTFWSTLNVDINFRILQRTARTPICNLLSNLSGDKKFGKVLSMARNSVSN